jgi:hypothetical protein
MAKREKSYRYRGQPLDGNAKARITAWVDTYNARHRQPGQHHGPLTWAYQRVLKVLLWGFHNQHTGLCYPGYDAIAAKARCHRDTVCEAIKALERAGILTWVHRLLRFRHHERSFVYRTSNGYSFRDPQTRADLPVSPKSENPTGTLNQDSFLPSTPPIDPDSPLERALAQLGEAIATR